MSIQAAIALGLLHALWMLLATNSTMTLLGQSSRHDRLSAQVMATVATPLVFRGVTVIDVQVGRRLRNQAVVVIGNRIQAIGPAEKTRLPTGAWVIDARDKYLIPGLWDMELYLDGAPDPLMWQLIANGVTGYRNLGQAGGGTAGRTTIDSMLTWRREIAAGTRIGPRILIGGPMINACENCDHGKVVVGVSTPERARHLVDSLRTAGADHIFVYDIPRREIAFAILAEARRLRMPVVGHLPDSISLIEASDSGMRAVDHMHGTDNICFGSQFLPGSRPSVPLGAPTVSRCAELAYRLRQKNSWIAIGPLYFTELSSRLTPRELFRRQQYTPGPFRVFRTEDAAGKELNSRSHELPADFFSVADYAGLPILMSTDLGATQALPVGFQLHDDLAVAVEHGLRPLTALQAVTLNAARYMGATDSLGTVEVGKLADLVLLDGDPLVSIYNTQRIHAVVSNGRYFNRAGLDSLLVRAGSARP